MEIAPETRALVEASFAAEDVEAAMAQLDRYGHESWHRERDRVHRAILTLSKGKLDDLADCAGMAWRDYRDVLLLAEYPDDVRRHSEGDG